MGGEIEVSRKVEMVFFGLDQIGFDLMGIHGWEMRECGGSVSILGGQFNDNYMFTV